MTHLSKPFVADHRVGDVIARGLSWGLTGGAVSGALFVLPLVLWNGPVAALLIYPAMAAIPGAVIGTAVGVLAAWGLAAVPPATAAGARASAAFTSALCVAWVPLLFGLPLVALWVLALSSAAGAVLGPRVSARRSGAATATGTASPGSSRAPGR